MTKLETNNYFTFSVSLVYLVIFTFLTLTACSNSPAQVKTPYSGQYQWSADTATLTFTSSGSLQSNHVGWTVPTAIKTIMIAENVTVQGRFNINHDMEIKGQDNQTSEIYGTPELKYNKRNNGCGLCKSAVLGRGDITIKITNLTSRNPYGFHFTGKDGTKMIIDGIRAIDDRGGQHNNSDGVSAASGTIVRNSYFDTADDIIKVYNDITVEDTVIKMGLNSVPIQFGWGSYGNGAVGVFKNVTIIGEGGRRSTGNAVIDARKGRYNKTIIMDNMKIKNPNAVLVNFWNENAPLPAGKANVTITNSDIEVKALNKRWNMDVDMNICEQPALKNSPQTTWQCK